MGNDVPYDVPTDDGLLTEIPVHWIMDAAPLFRYVYGATNAIADRASRSRAGTTSMGVRLGTRASAREALTHRETFRKSEGKDTKCRDS